MGLTSPYQTNYPAAYKMSQQQNILKRKRSFKRRRFMQNVVCVSMAIIFLMTQNFNRAQATPARDSGYLKLHGHVHMHQQQQEQQQREQLWHQRNTRNVGASLSASLQQQQLQRENFKDSLQQSSSTEVSMEQPQGQCLLDGEYVPETRVFCEKQGGCRAIQKTGHCCPDYKCDCQKDGKTYLNGDKLVDPETPCTVCYCQGGEILCSSVTCFHRDDCTPKYIPGVCCPEYDNCPVATSESTVTNKTLLTTSTTAKPEIHPAENNPKITIKEITKPTEIRITNDNKAIPIQQMFKPSTTSTTPTTTTTTTTSTTSTTPLPPPTSTLIYAVSTTTTSPHQHAINTNYTTSLDSNQQLVESFDTFSVAGNQKKTKNKNISKGGLNSGDTLKLSASVAYPSTILTSAGMISTPAPIDFSAEVEDPVPALSVFSTQGLLEDPSKVNIKREYLITTEGASSSGAALLTGFGTSEYQNSELIFSQSPLGQNALNTQLQQSSGESDTDTAGSDNIYHIILTTDGPRLTTSSENYLANKGISTTEGLIFDGLAASSSNPIESNNNTKEISKQGPSAESAIHQHLDDEDSAIPLESNPAYPSLPEDDFSLRDNNFQINDADDVADEPRSVSGGHGVAIKSTKHLDDHTYGSGSGSGGGMLLDELAVTAFSSSTEGSGDLVVQQSTENYDNFKSPEIIQLMYSSEDSAEEIKMNNATEFKFNKNKAYSTAKTDDTSFESNESRQQPEFEMGSGSGSGEIKLPKQRKEREPTTAKPNKKQTDIEIDELHDASANGPENDPKLDAESLKLDETVDDLLPTNPDKSAKHILSIAETNNFHKDLH